MDGWIHGCIQDIPACVQYIHANHTCNTFLRMSIHGHICTCMHAYTYTDRQDGKDRQDRQDGQGRQGRQERHERQGRQDCQDRQGREDREDGQGRQGRQDGRDGRDGREWHRRRMMMPPPSATQLASPGLDPQRSLKRPLSCRLSGMRKLARCFGIAC